MRNIAIVSQKFGLVSEDFLPNGFVRSGPYCPYMPRIELRVSDEQLAELDRLRGALPRGTFLKVSAGLVGVPGEVRVFEATPAAPAPSFVKPPAFRSAASSTAHHPKCACYECKPPKS